MSLLTIPLECLRLVLKILQDRKDTFTLSVLLRVNSYFCSATLPYLYSRALDSPAFYIPHLFTMVCSDHVKLLQTLLRQRPRELVSDLLDAAYDVYPERSEHTISNLHPDKVQGSEVTQTSPSGIDYLSLMHAFIFESVVYRPKSGCHPVQSINYPSRLAAYIFRSKTGDAADEYGDGLQDDSLLFPPMFKVGHTKRTEQFRYGALSGALRRELTWTICSAVFEQIQSLAIPLSDMARYLDSVERFQSLRHVIFIMDELLDLQNAGDHVLEPRLDREQCLARRDQQFRSMITFMQRHAALFPNQIQRVDCPVEHTWPNLTVCPEEVMSELKDCLPVMVNPKTIDNNNWQQITRQFKSTNLDSVSEISMLGSLARSGMSSFLTSQPTFLSRCRALESLVFNSPGPGSFKWAVKEKLAWKQFGAALAIAGGGRLPESITPPGELLPPLQRVTIATFGTFSDEIDDIAFAFGEILLELCAFTFALDEESEESIGFRAGNGWTLPRIRKLHLAIQHKRLLIDRDFYALGLGNKIESLSLEDKSTGYHCQDVYTCRPLQVPLPALKTVALQGWSALTFHPDTLHRVPNLESLHLGVFSYTTDHFIPPVQELLDSFQPMEDRGVGTSKKEGDVGHAADEDNSNSDVNDGSLSNVSLLSPLAQRRPRRTWDWYLPKLQTLKLTAEWAFMFEFRMLEGCQSLELLSLNIYADSEGRAHERQLTTQDFVRSAMSGTLESPIVQEQEQDVEDGKSRFLVAPAIQTVLLYGHWIVDDAALRAMYGTTFSNVVLVNESGISGYTLQTWLSTLHGLPKLREASCGLQPVEGEEQMPVPEETLRAHGLVPRPITSSTNSAGVPEKVFRFQGVIACWSFAKDMEKSQG
ncbi:hypothetical protein BGZ83_000979 [Gryganskiella cystojenkinii]|nr:hypothetical protein BGZ83_000979 [Gryganskiella cystojenkinii]